MMLMTKEEVHYMATIWAANAKSPIDRDTQIMLMSTAARRHKDNINKIIKQLERKENDPLG